MQYEKSTKRRGTRNYQHQSFHAHAHRTSTCTTQKFVCSQHVCTTPKRASQFCKRTNKQLKRKRKRKKYKEVHAYQVWLSKARAQHRARTHIIHTSPCGACEYTSDSNNCNYEADMLITFMCEITFVFI